MDRVVQLGLLVCLCILPIQLAEQGQGKGKGKKPPPEPVIMGLRFFDGGERRIDILEQSGQPWVPISNGGPLSSTTARTGNRSLVLDTANKNGHSHDYNFDHAGGTAGGLGPTYNIATTYLSFYLRRSGTSSGQPIVSVRDSTQTNKLRLLWSGSTNKLVIETATGNTVGTTVLASDTWYRIDIRCGTGSSAFWELRVSNSVELSATEDLLTTNMAGFVFWGTNSHDTRIDDVVLRDDQYHKASDDYRIVSIFPDGDGNYTSWTGTWVDVDDKSSDGNESTTSTQNNRETYTLENIPTLAGNDTIDAVMTVAIVRKTSNAAVNCQMIERESLTDRDTVDFLVLKNDSYRETVRWLIQTTKPSGGAWTEAAVNGYEVGLEHNQSQVRDILLDNINVNVLISTTAPASAANIYHHFQNLGVY